MIFFHSLGSVKKVHPAYGNVNFEEKEERKGYMHYYVAAILVFWMSVFLVVLLFCKLTVFKKGNPYCLLE